jgi:hypothetical protein
MGVDNALAPHGSPFAERVLSPDEAPGAFTGLTQVPVRSHITECVGLTPGGTVALLQ